MILQIVLSLVCIGTGALLIFGPAVQTKVLCYIFCAGLITAAVVEIARFFISEAYNRLYDYSFAIGIMLLILGICGFLRIDDLVKHFQLAVGLIALAIGTVILQGMVQLNVIDNLLWILLMIFTTVILVGSVLLIIDVKPVIGLIPNFTYWLLFCAGIASLLSMLIVALALFLARRKKKKAAEQESDTEFVEFEEEPEIVDAVPAAASHAVPAAALADAAQSAAPAVETASAKPQIAEKPGSAAAPAPALEGTKPAADSVPTGETQIFPPITGKTGGAAENPFHVPDKEDMGAAAPAKEEAKSVTQDIFAAVNEESIPEVKYDPFTLPEIVPPEDL